MVPSIMSQENHYNGGTSVLQLDRLSIDVDQQMVKMDIDMDPAPGAVGDHMKHFEMVPETHTITVTSLVQTAVLSPFAEHQTDEENDVDEHTKGIENNIDVKFFDALELPDSQPAAYLELLERNLLGFIRVAHYWRSVWADKDKTHDINKHEQWGLRQIQSGRIEIFLKNEDHPVFSPASLALAMYIKEKSGITDDPHDFWSKILLYAEQSAKRDTRVSYGFDFGSYSLICTTGKVTAQVPHLDIMLPNYQFTLMITDNSPGTIVYTSINTNPVHDVPSFMKWLGEPIDSNIADNRVCCLRSLASQMVELCSRVATGNIFNTNSCTAGKSSAAWVELTT
jgi:hypothetical protein